MFQCSLCFLLFICVLMLSMWLSYVRQVPLLDVRCHVSVALASSASVSTCGLLYCSACFAHCWVNIVYWCCCYYCLTRDTVRSVRRLSLKYRYVHCWVNVLALWVRWHALRSRGLTHRCPVVIDCDVHTYCPRSARMCCTANLRTNIMDFRASDSSIILIMRGGILRSIGDFPESLMHAVLVGAISAGRLGVQLTQGLADLFRQRNTPSSHSKNSLYKICSKGWVAQAPFCWLAITNKFTICAKNVQGLGPIGHES